MRLLFYATASIIALVAAVAAAVAEEPKRSRPPSFEEMRKMRSLEWRALALEPRRRDTPLRELNLTDNEVREIEGIAANFALHSMLNISPVTTGCACEEGPLCTDQVYVVATVPGKTVGLQLSRVRNAWTVGPVQLWWLRYAALAQRAAKMDALEFFDAKSALLQEFPMCVGNDPVPDTKTARAK